MSLPILHKIWTFSTNNRIPFVSLNNATSKLLFGIKNFLVVTMGYTVKYTCDGTTGPTSSSDHTDRWLSSANCTTRGGLTTAAQSFCVLTDGNSVDVLLTYQGSTDDTMKMSMSVGGLFLPAGTPNQQPTATDETIILPSGSSAVGGLGSGDRIWHIMATTDKKMFRVFVNLTGFMTYAFGVDIVTTAVTGPSWTPATVGWATNVSNPNGGAAGHALVASTTVGNCGVARINGTNITCGGGGEVFLGSTNSNVFGENNSPLEAGAPISALGFYSPVSTLQGKVGDRLDVYYVWSNAIAQGDTFGANQWVYMATALWPWNGGPVVLS